MIFFYPAHGRQWISRAMRTVGPTQFLRGGVIFLLFFRFIFLFLRGYMPFLKKKMRKITQPLKYYVGPTIRIGWDIHCLPYAGFFLLFLFTVYHCFTVFTGIFYCLQFFFTYLLGEKNYFFKHLTPHGVGAIDGFCHQIFLICKNYFPGSRLPNFSHSAWHTSWDD